MLSVEIRAEVILYVNIIGFVFPVVYVHYRKLSVELHGELILYVNIIEFFM